VKKSAFTMLELVFVIVVIGILAMAIIPRMDRDTVYEAAEQLVSHIKYTQHLAMTDNVYDHNDPNWYQNRWRITFNGNTYEVSKSAGASFAQDPLTKADMDGSGDYDLAAKYNITLSTLPANNIIAFDHLGRPYSNLITSPQANLMMADVNITLTETNDEKAFVIVVAETGYTYVHY
jgi:prepilin-type N-terminal cleavage/methylation domain-containing protein